MLPYILVTSAQNRYDSRMRVLHTGIKFYKAIFKLLKSENFISLSLLGNSVVMFFAFSCFLVERENGRYINSIFDAIWWAYATATGVGYGDVIPESTAGKTIGIILMLVGTLLFATFTALFAKSILEEEIFVVSDESLINQNENDLLQDLKEHKKKLEKHIASLEKKSSN